MRLKEALDIIEKRVRCSNHYDGGFCNHRCEGCKYVLTPEESDNLSKSLEIVWKTAKHYFNSTGETEDGVNIKCSYLLPCGLCEHLTKVYGLSHECKYIESEVKNNAKER